MGHICGFLVVNASGRAFKAPADSDVAGKKQEVETRHASKTPLGQPKAV
jgi:hypothetical protein